MKFVLFTLCLCLISFPSFKSTQKLSNTNNNLQKIDNAPIEIDAGQGSGFYFNPGNKGDGIYFFLPENEAPYNSDYNVNYYASAESCIQLVRGNETIDIAVYNGENNRDILKKISPTQYYLRTIDGWTIKNNILPFIKDDKVTIQGVFTHNDYRLNISASSFKINKDGEIEAGTNVKETLSITPDVTANKLEKTSDRGLYFHTTGSNMPFNSSWGLRYHAKDTDNNFAIARENTFTNYPDVSTDGYIVAYAKDDFYVDFWIVGGETKFLDGDILYFGGTYYYLDILTDTKYNFELDNFVVLLNEINGQIVAKLLNNYAEYLLEQLTSKIDLDIYTSESQKTIYEKFHEYRLFISDESKNFKKCWDKYVECKLEIESLPQDEEAKQIKLSSAKLEAIDKITSSYNLDLYLEDNKNLILKKQETCIKSIGVATDINTINAIIKEYNDFVIKLNTKETIYCNEVLKNNPIGSTTLTTTHLEKFDTVTLTDIGQPNEIVFSTDPALKQKNINTDDVFDNTYENTFPTSIDNCTYSISFKFKYVVDINNMNLGLAFKLRGIRYCGYKFILSDNNYGIYLKRTLKAGEEFLTGVSNVFNDIGEYDVEIGAIDIIDSKNTFMYAFVNGSLKCSSICEKLPYGLNRLDMKAEMNVAEQTIGTATLKNAEICPNYNCTRVSRLIPKEYNGKTINFTADSNALPYSKDKSINSYALRNDSVKLIRNGKTTSIAQPNVAILNKQKEDLYVFDLYTILDNPQKDDHIIIEGYFAYFDAQINEKAPFFIPRSEIVYDGTNWNRISPTIDETKEDALYTLNNYIVESNYTESNLNSVKQIINNGIEKINKASSIDEVNSILVSTLNDANNIPTLIVQKRNIVIDEMRSKIEEIKPLYLEEQVKELEDITSLYIEKINNSYSIDEIDSLKSNFLVEIDKVYTEIEMLEIQLLAKKEDAISKIRDLYSRCNIDSLNKSDADSINQKVIKCIDDIKNTENVETVEQLKDSIVNELTSKFNLNSNKNSVNVGLIVGLSVGGVVLLGGLLTSFIIIKKKKEEKQLWKK